MYVHLENKKVMFIFEHNQFRPTMNTKKFLVLFAVLISFSIVGFAQDCTPDPELVDTANPGEVVVLPLPDAIQFENYDYTVTIIPPDSYEGLDIIYSIIIDSVVGLPPGMNWYKNEEEFFVTDPDTRYCVNLYGEPTEQGEFPMTLYITPYIDFFGTPVASTQQVDDTSMSIFVDAPVGLPDFKGFVADKAYPNPFSYQTKIQFTTSRAGIAELVVYNVLGNVIYRERLFAESGKNAFYFDGSDLCAGTYIYTIEHNGKKETNRIMKSK